MSQYENLKEIIKNELLKNKKNKPVLFFMMGIPASGKSTVVKYLSEDFNISEVLSLDNLSEEYAEKNSIPYSVAVTTGMKEIKKKFTNQKELLKSENKSFIWDQVNSNKNHRLGKVNYFKNSHFIIGICINPESENIIKRMIHRKLYTDKILSMNMVNQMAKDFSIPTLDEGFNEVLFYSEKNIVKLSENPDFKLNVLDLSKENVDKKLEEMGLLKHYYEVYNQRQKLYKEIKENIKLKKFKP